MGAMSEDWLVRGSRPVELAEVVTALGDLVPDLSLRGDRSGHSLVVVHQDAPVVWIGASREVADPWAPWLPGGATRGGAWWTEVTGPTDRPVPAYDAPQLLVRLVAEAIAGATEGSALRLSAASVPTDRSRPETRDAPPPSPSPYADPPADMVNEAVAVLVQSRPVVALTPWLVNNHVWAQAHDRQFVLLTPAATELTLAAWSYLQNTDAAWVVDAGDSMFHGLVGLEVEWSGVAFELTERVHPAFTPAAGDRWHVLVEAETTHPYTDSARIGAFSRDLLASVGLQAPARQGLMEPPEAAFDVAELTTYARTLSPRPSRFVLQGPGWEAVCEAVPQPVGVVERLTVSATPGPEPLGGPILDGFLDRARDVGAETALLGYRRAGAEGQVPSRLTGPTVPAALHLSRRRFPSLSDGEARRVGGPAAMLDDSALQVSWSLEAAEDEPESNPAVQLVTLLDAVQHHDSHRHAAASSGG